jgi:hypothetical protein
MGRDVSKMTTSTIDKCNTETYLTVVEYISWAKRRICFYCCGTTLFGKMTSGTQGLAQTMAYTCVPAQYPLLLQITDSFLTTFSIIAF